MAKLSREELESSRVLLRFLLRMYEAEDWHARGDLDGVCAYKKECPQKLKRDFYGLALETAIDAINQVLGTVAPEE